MPPAHSVRLAFHDLEVGTLVRDRLIVHSLCAIAAATVFVPHVARGQVAATFQWLVSSDNGSTWQNDLAVDQSQSSVLVRARVSWDPIVNTYFAQTVFDATVTATTGGSSDTVSNIGSQPSSWNYFQHTAFASFRFGDTLKIDEARDTLAPGVGPYWIGPNQSTPLGPPLMHPENPVDVFQYQLNLDGSLGRRDISAVFLNPMSRPNRFIGIYQPPYTQSDIWVPSTLVPGSVTVVPGPGVVGVVGLGTIVLLRRRR